MAFHLPTRIEPVNQREGNKWSSTIKSVNQKYWPIEQLPAPPQGQHTQSTMGGACRCSMASKNEDAAQTLLDLLVYILFGINITGISDSVKGPCHKIMYLIQ